MSVANIIDEMMNGAEVVIRRQLGSIIAGQARTSMACPQLPPRQSPKKGR
jgi:hypothetical protein